MLDLFLQRLRSKTYQLTLVGTLLSILEVKAQVISQFFPLEYREYFVLAWPAVMLTVREFTDCALSEK